MKNRLKKGEKIFFNNEQHQIEVKSDDVREAKVEFRGDWREEWRNGFKIWFNGALIHSSKTFKSMEKRLNKLIKDWHLIESEEM